MVKIVSTDPHPTVVKEAICKNCGCTLSYVPADVTERYSTDYTGGLEYHHTIRCPSCNQEVKVKK